MENVNVFKPNFFKFVFFYFIWLPWDFSGASWGFLRGGLSRVFLVYIDYYPKSPREVRESVYGKKIPEIVWL